MKRWFEVLLNTLNTMKIKSLGVGTFSDGQGLWLYKRRKDAGRWFLRVSLNGRRREMGLGGCPDVTLADVRDAARDARSIVRKGVDPILERDKQRRNINGLTVKEAIDMCFKAKQAELKDDGESGKWMSPLCVHVLPNLGNYPIEELDQHRILTVLGPIWHTKPSAAEKALNRLNLPIKHAAALGLNVDIQATLKAKVLLGKQRHVATHIPSLDYKNISSFYNQLDANETTSSLALRFLILTTCRTSEIRLATFSEVRDDVWTIAARRTKSGNEHRVPLSNECLKLVEEARQRSDNDYLFQARLNKPLSNMAMAKLMTREGYDERPHGFRATFRTWVEEKTDTPFEVKETALGQSIDGSIVLLISAQIDW